MRSELFIPSRRVFLGAFGTALFTTPGLFADQLARTPEREEGPFYPDKLPLDTDNDLIIINDAITPAVGEITHLTGRVLDASGSPVRNALVEIWQCDANEVYLHTGDNADRTLDKNFQGFGRFTTGSTGEYRFRTIKPVPYPGRPAPHIHFKVKKGDRELLTTQLNIAGHPGNKVDGVASGGLGGLRPRAASGRLQADQGVEDRRAGGPLRDRPRHALRTSEISHRRQTRPAESRICKFDEITTKSRTTMKTLSGMFGTAALLIAASLATAQGPGRGEPRDSAESWRCATTS